MMLRRCLPGNKAAGAVVTTPFTAIMALLVSGMAWGAQSPRALSPGRTGLVHCGLDCPGSPEVAAAPAEGEVRIAGRRVYWRPPAGAGGTHRFLVRCGGEEVAVDVEVRQPRGALFVFAHSDDEFGIIAKVDRLRRTGVEVHGAWTSVSPGTRREESREAWRELKIPAARLHYGPAPCRSGGLAATRDFLAELLREHHFQEVYVVGYEGGHIQHDLTHFALVEAVKAAGFRGQVYEFGLYNFSRFPFPTLLRPVPASPPRQVIRLDWRDYRRLQDLTSFYPSQRRVTTGFRLFLPIRHKRRQVYRPLPRWDYTRPPYGGRPLWYSLSPRHRDDFEDDFLARIKEYYRATGREPPAGTFEQDL